MEILATLLSLLFWLGPPIAVLVLAIVLARRKSRSVHARTFLLYILKWGVYATVIYLVLIFLVSLLLLSLHITSLLLFVPWVLAAGMAIGIAKWPNSKEAVTK